MLSTSGYLPLARSVSNAASTASSIPIDSGVAFGQPLVGQSSVPDAGESAHETKKISAEKTYFMQNLTTDRLSAEGAPFYYKRTRTQRRDPFGSLPVQTGEQIAAAEMPKTMFSGGECGRLYEGVSTSSALPMRSAQITAHKTRPAAVPTRYQPERVTR